MKNSDELRVTSGEIKLAFARHSSLVTRHCF
jgi:hypothetical protein